MDIDWVTVAAQVVNFLVLVLLLKRFLYTPVITAMDNREASIAERLNEAERREQQADERARRYRQRLDELDRQRDTLMEQARQDAQAERTKRVENARQEVEQLERQWRQTVDQEREAFLSGLRKTAAESILDVARRAIGDLADADLEHQAVEVFLRRLAELENDQRRVLTEQSGEIVIASRLALPDEDRRAIADALKSLTGRAPSLRFIQDAKPIFGVELRAGHFRVGWNAAGYLEDLERNVRDYLQ